MAILTFDAEFEDNKDTMHGSTSQLRASRDRFSEITKPRDRLETARRIPDMNELFLVKQSCGE